MERGTPVVAFGGEQPIDLMPDFGRPVDAHVQQEVAPLNPQEILDGVGVGHVGEQMIRGHDGVERTVNETLKLCPHFLDAIKVHHELAKDLTDDNAMVAKSVEKFIFKTVATPELKQTALAADAEVEKKN